MFELEPSRTPHYVFPFPVVNMFNLRPPVYTLSSQDRALQVFEFCTKHMDEAG